MLYEDGNGNQHDTSDLDRLARRCAAVAVVALAATAYAAPPNQTNGIVNSGGTPVSVENRSYAERKTDSPAWDMLARFVPTKVRVALVGIRHHINKHTEQG